MSHAAWLNGAISPPRYRIDCCALDWMLNSSRPCQSNTSFFCQQQSFDPMETGAETSHSLSPTGYISSRAGTCYDGSISKHLVQFSFRLWSFR